MFEGFKERKTKEEILRRLGRVSDSNKIKYLERILSKKSLLNPITQKVAYSMLGDIYLRDAEQELHQLYQKYGKDENEAIPRSTHLGREGKGELFKDTEDLIKAGENLLKANEVSKARRFLNYWEPRETVAGADGTGIRESVRRTALYVEDTKGEHERVYSLLNRGDALRKKLKSSGVENKVIGIVTLFGLGAGLLFLSPNFTGNVIGNMANSTSNILGAVLLVIGLIAGFFYFKSRK